jgi:SAM-dependent methyltransferase
MLDFSQLRNDARIIWHSLRVWGPREAVVELLHYMQARWHERTDRFDERYGVETRRMVGLLSLNAQGPHGQDASHYWPTREDEFEQAMAAVEPLDPSGSVFVDIGCGKGRVVLIAAMRPFERVVGLDFSPDLVASAQENLRRFRGPIRAGSVELVVEDAGAYEFPESNLVVYMFDPFGPPVMQKMIDNLKASQRRNPRDIVVVYYSPDYGDMFVDAGFAELASGVGKFWDWAVYRLPRSV